MLILTIYDHKMFGKCALISIGNQPVKTKIGYKNDEDLMYDIWAFQTLKCRGDVSVWESGRFTDKDCLVCFNNQTEFNGAVNDLLLCGKVISKIMRYDI